MEVMEMMRAVGKQLGRQVWGGGDALWHAGVWRGAHRDIWPEEPLFMTPCHPAVDHVVPDPESSLVEAFERWREWADGKACCDYALHVDIPRWSQRVRQELHAMVQEKGLLPFLPCPWLGVGGLAERGTWWMRCPCSSGC